MSTRFPRGVESSLRGRGDTVSGVSRAWRTQLTKIWRPWAVTFDQESFLRALDHLQEAQSRLSKPDRAATEPPGDIRQIVKVLRNAYEHWTTERRKDGPRRAELAALYPDSNPWSLQWTETGLLIGGALALEPTLVWVRQVKDFAATKSPRGR